MKAGIVGIGSVGRAVAFATLQRGSTQGLILVNRNSNVSKAVALDMGYGGPLGASTTIRAGDYRQLAGVGIVVITAGVNEKTGGATDRQDQAGRLRLLEQNFRVMQDVIPPIVAAAPSAVVLVATDPPDPLTDVVRDLAPGVKVFGTGTWLDCLRFRVHLAEALGVSPRSVRADVLGEHGKSEVLHWSGAAVGNVPWQNVVAQRGLNEQAIKARVDDAVRLANINIIEGIGASQYGIGTVIARLIEAVLHDEKLIAPVGSHRPEHGVTLSLPSVIGAAGVEEVLSPRLDAHEQDLLKNSIGVLRSARARILAQPSAA